MHRTTSESTTSASPSGKMWRLSSLRSRISKNSVKEDKNWTKPSLPSSSFDSNDITGGNLNRTTSHVNLQDAGTENNYRQLQSLIQKMRNTPSGPSHIDAGYNQFSKLKEKCSALCSAVLTDDPRLMRTISHIQEPTVRRDSSTESPRSPGAYHDGRSSFSGRSFGETITQTGTIRSNGGGGGGQFNEAYLTAVRDWKACLEALVEAFKVNLAETYKSYERDATPEMVEALFASKKFRKDAINRMRNASVTRVMSADPQFFPKYDIRFRNMERIKAELIKIRQILQSGESGISPSRRIDEYIIDPRGDVILEFANVGEHTGLMDPALRFQVSSQLIKETSPVFARMCNGSPTAMKVHEEEGIETLLPPPPSEYICKDGSKAILFRMPQHELNRHQSLEIMLNAAHGKMDTVPRDVSFDQFVAIAECSFKYKCSLPLEQVVEHDWLPQWMHKGADEMPDGLLIITYTFGLRQLFTRMSKTAILNIVDERDLHNKPWPQKFKDKIWAVRCAKIDQIHRCCTDAIRDYIRAPTKIPDGDAGPPEYEVRNSQSPAAPPKRTIGLSSTPRCPKGSHSCDAINLGWLSMVFNEMNILHHVLRPELMAHLPDRQWPSMSLVSLIDTLRRIPSPDAPLHRGGVCDPIPAFRSVMADILNSVQGLTLHDISGKSHGWALSRHRMAEPQALLTRGLDRMAAHDERHSVVTEFPEIIRLRILGELDDLGDLHAMARVNKTFYDTYKVHELYLMRRILKADRRRAGTMPLPKPANMLNREEKVLKDDADIMKEMYTGSGRDAMTIRSEADDEDCDYEGDSDLETPAPSIYNGQTRSNAHSNRTSSTSQTPSGHETGTGETPAVRSTGVRFLRPHDTPPKPTVVHHESANDHSEAPMTEEEANRILWPEPLEEYTPPTQSIHVLPSGTEVVREKFLAGDKPTFSETLEEKTLMVAEEKQLRSEHEQRIGLRKDGRPDTGDSEGSKRLG